MHLFVLYLTKLGSRHWPVSWGEILLVEETFLQLEDLMVGEGGPRLAFLLRLLSTVEEVQMTALAFCNTWRDSLRIWFGRALLEFSIISDKTYITPNVILFTGTRGVAEQLVDQVWKMVDVSRVPDHHTNDWKASATILTSLETHQIFNVRDSGARWSIGLLTKDPF